MFSIAGRLYKPKKVTGEEVDFKTFAVFIPGYKEDEVIIEVASHALKQSYPKEHYTVFVIADSFKKNTIEGLKKLDIEIINVEFEKSTKVKSLNYALDKIDADLFDYAVILDADNLMQADFLQKLNQLHQTYHYKAIQGCRAAKNLTNTMSFLDGLSEAINNHIYGKGSSYLRLSSTLKGSGMSFKYGILKSLLSEMDSIGGFDRELELKLINSGIKVHYASDVIVLDEKVERTQVFENQRKRWISSQFFYLKKYFGEGIKSFFKGKLTFFNSSILRNIQLPRLLNLGLITIFTIVFILPLPINSLILKINWLVAFSVMFIGMILAIPKEYFNKNLIKALLSLPLIFIKMLRLLFRLKGANEKFIHTPHSSSTNTEKDKKS